MTQHRQNLDRILKEVLLRPEALELDWQCKKVVDGWKAHLTTLFPVSFQLLGKGSEMFLLGFLRAFPPRSWNKALFGFEFPSYLKQDSSQKLPKYIPEIAQYEWSLHWADVAPVHKNIETTYKLNAFVTYLKLEHSIHIWWKEKKGKPQRQSSLLIMSKAKDSVYIFEPNLAEAMIVDSLSENQLSMDQLIISAQTRLPGMTDEDLRRAIQDLTTKGVIAAPVGE